MADITLEDLFARFATGRDLDALAEVFDRVAPKLERLARKLTADRSAAEDLVQATFLTALERPATFDAGRPLTPWLLGILVHRASSDRRREARRAELVQAAGRDQSEPEQALASLGATEFRETVARAIEDLPSSLRAVVEGRLLQDKDSNELAQELAISRGTLRVRLHRGLERLRSILPPSLATAFAALFIHSRGLAQVRSHVLQEAARISVAQGLTVSAGAATGALGIGTMIMTKQVVLIVGAALLALLVGVLYFNQAPDGADPMTIRSSEAELAEIAARAPTSAQPPLARADVGQAPVTSAASSLATVVVRVLYADDSPAADHEVQLTLTADGDTETRTQQTDESGQSKFELPAGTRVRNVSTPVGATTTSASTWVSRIVRGGDLVELELTISTGWELAGRVVGDDGRPVPSAEVFGWCSDENEGEAHRSVRADSNGEFRLEHLGPEFVVTARAPGLACSKGLRGKLTDAVLAEGLTIELVPERRMHGVVLDPARIPVAGAEVWISNGLSSYSDLDLTQVAGVRTFWAGRAKTHSDAQGRFELTGLSHERDTLHVKQAPYLVYRESHETGDTPVEVVLDSGLVLSGRVFDASGAPAVGAGVRYWPFYGNVQTVEREVFCDEAGRFSLRGMIAKPEHGEPNYAIAIHHEGHALHVIQPVKPDRAGGEHVEVRLEPERVIAGRVVDLKGKPVAGVEVWIEGDREMDTGARYNRRSTWEFCNGLDDGVTDEDGSFRFGRLYDGEFTLHAVSPGDPNSSVDFETRSGNEEIELVLDPEAMRKVVFAGQVRDARTGEPVTAFSVWPAVDGWSKANEFEDAEGRFELSGLSEGLIQVSVRADGYAIRRIDERNYNLGRHQFDIELVRERSLQLIVVDQLGGAYSSGSVEVFDLEGQRLMVGTHSSRSSQVQLREGRAHLHGLPAEQLTLHIKAGLRKESGVHKFPVDLTNQLTGPLELILDRAPAPVDTAELSLAVLVLAPGQDEVAMTKALYAAMASNDRTVVGEAMKSGALTFPESPVKLVVTAGEREVVRASLTPKEDGGFLIEQSALTQSWGGSSEGWNSTSESNFPGIHLDALPTAKLLIHATAEGYLEVHKEVDSTPVANEDAKDFILLRRL